jgi:hypothetical protein
MPAMSNSNPPTPTSSSKEELEIRKAFHQIMQSHWWEYDNTPTTVLEDCENALMQLYRSLLSSQKETLLDELLSEMPTIIKAKSTKDFASVISATWYNKALSEIKAIIEKKRKEL